MIRWFSNLVGLCRGQITSPNSIITFWNTICFRTSYTKILPDTSVGLILGDASSFAERVLGVLTPGKPEAIVVDIAKRNLVPLAMFKIFIQPRKLPGNGPMGATDPCLVILAVLQMVVRYLRKEHGISLETEIAKIKNYKCSTKEYVSIELVTNLDRYLAGYVVSKKMFKKSEDEILSEINARNKRCDMWTVPFTLSAALDFGNNECCHSNAIKLLLIPDVHCTRQLTTALRFNTMCCEQRFFF